MNGICDEEIEKNWEYFSSGIVNIVTNQLFIILIEIIIRQNNLENGNTHKNMNNNAFATKCC